MSRIVVHLPSEVTVQIRTKVDASPKYARSERRAGQGALQAVTAAWLLSLGIDLLLHGGLLAGLYLQESPFILGPEAAFRRIPFGYFTFLVLTASLYWLLDRLRVRGAMDGLRYGSTAAAIVWGALMIGLYSITTAPVSLLAGWWAGQTLELGLAGAMLGAAAAGLPARRMWSIVAVVVFGCIVVTVALQSLGLAPAMKIAP
jgi:hypothetical protein